MKWSWVSNSVCTWSKAASLICVSRSLPITEELTARVRRQTQLMVAPAWKNGPRVSPSPLTSFVTIRRVPSRLCRLDGDIAMVGCLMGGDAAGALAELTALRPAHAGDARGRQPRRDQPQCRERAQFLTGEQRLRPACRGRHGLFGSPSERRYRPTRRHRWRGLRLLKHLADRGDAHAHPRPHARRDGADDAVQAHRQRLHHDGAGALIRGTRAVRSPPIR